MPARIHSRSLLAASILVSLASGATIAQSIIVTNGPATNNTIPLAPNSTVAFDSTGNLRVTCALNASSVCTALAGTVAPVGAPTSAFQRTDSNIDVRTGDNVSFSWTSVGAEACRASAVTPNAVGTSWAGVRDTAGTENVTVNTVGTYELSLQCFNAGGGSTRQTHNVAVTQTSGGTVTPPAGCNLPADPQLQPAGWARVNKTWQQAWTPPNNSTTPVYPASPGYPIPVGADKNSYTVIGPFTPNVGQVVKVDWNVVQASVAIGYSQARPADSMYFTISPCPGDLRRPDTASSDPFLQTGCRRGGQEGSITFHTLDNTPSNFQYCHLTAGQQYYMTVIAATPEDGLTAGEHTCAPVASAATHCDVNAFHQPTN